MSKRLLLDALIDDHIRLNPKTAKYSTERILKELVTIWKGKIQQALSEKDHKKVSTLLMWCSWLDQFVDSIEAKKPPTLYRVNEKFYRHLLGEARQVLERLNYSELVLPKGKD